MILICPSVSLFLQMTPFLGMSESKAKLHINDTIEPGLESGSKDMTNILLLKRLSVRKVVCVNVIRLLGVWPIPTGQIALQAYYFSSIDEKDPGDSERPAHWLLTHTLCW